MSLKLMMIIGLFLCKNYYFLIFHNVSVTYRIEEEQSHHITVGNLYSDFKIEQIAANRNCSYQKNLCQLMFFPSSQPARKYFGLISTSSHAQETYLVTISRIDREEICYDKVFESKSHNSKICQCKRKTPFHDPICSTVFHITLSPFITSQIFLLLLVEVVIIDKNDNPPLFPQRTINVYLSLKKEGPSSMILPNATDKDIGINSVINYKLLNHTNFIQIKPSHSGLNLSIININKAAEYFLHSQPLSIKILAINTEKPFFNDTLTIRLFIDNAIPESLDLFSQKIYFFKVEENINVGTVIGRVQLKSNKQINPKFKIEKCSNTLERSAGLFLEIGKHDGVIKTTGFLDREEQNQHCVEVVAAIGDHKEVYSTSTVSIKILDQNDNYPKIGLDSSIFEKKEVEIPENRPIDSTILTLFPEDPDEGENGTIFCDCLSHGQFAIEPLNKEYQTTKDLSGRLSYVLMNRIILDREISSYFSVTIFCYDKGKISLTSSVTIKLRILDMNDNPPVFPKNFYQISYPEDLEIGSHILTVNATDLDATRTNSQIFYSIRKSENSDLFSINERSGDIYLTSSLDYETCTYIVINVIASDRGFPKSLSGNVIVYFTVTDINDCFPQLQLSYTVYIAENLPIQSHVTSIVAHDSDTGFGGKVIHFISDTQFFSCSPYGDIKTKISFDRETRSSYTIIIYAKDMGNPSLTSSSSIFIKILDVNDNDPEFVFPPPSQGSANISISYREQSSSELTKVSCKDIDEGDNGKIIFTFFEYLLRKDIFFINSSSGIIYLTSTPGKYNLKKIFSLKVIAHDHGTPERRKSSANIFVQIVDIEPILKVKRTIDFSRIPVSFFDKKKSDLSEFSRFFWNIEHSAVTMVLAGILIVIIMSILTAVVCVCHKIQFPVPGTERTNVSSLSAHLVSNERSGVTITWRHRIKTPSVKWKCMASMLHIPYKSTPNTEIPVLCSNEYMDSERESLQLISTSRSLDRHQLNRSENDYEIIKAANLPLKRNIKRELSLIRQTSTNSDSSINDERMVTII